MISLRLLRDVANASVLALFFLSPIILFGPPDREEYCNTVISVMLNSLSLQAHGTFLTWTNSLGFGTPMPIGHDSTLYPLFWAWPYLPFFVLLPIYWTIHMVVATFFFGRLLRMYDVRGPLYGAALISYVFSSSYLTLVYQNDWPSLFFNWAMLPPIFYFAIRLVHQDQLKRSLSGTILLGLLIGITIAKAHFGHLAILLFAGGIAIFLVALERPKSLFYLVAAFLIALLIGGANIWFVISEARLVPDGILREAQAGYHFYNYFAAFIQPVGWVKEFVFPTNWSAFKSGYTGLLNEVRNPAFGAPFMLSSIVAAFVYTWRYVHRTPSGQLLGPLAIAFFVSLVFSFLQPEDLFNIPSGTWLFRDPLIFFGLLLAPAFLQQASLSPRWVAIIAGTQIFIVILSALPWIPYVVTAKHQNWYLATDAADPTLTSLAKAAGGDGQRIYVGPGAEQFFGRRIIVAELAAFDLAPINGWFKGITLDGFYPSRALMHGQIKSNSAVLSNQQLLNLLGIDLVLLKKNDLHSIQNAPDLHLKWKSAEGEDQLYLFENRGRWPRAFMANIGATNMPPLPRWNNCTLPGLLCANVEQLVAQRLNEKVIIQEGDSQIEVRFAPSQARRLLVLSTLYRADWEVNSSLGELQPVQVAGTLLATIVPAGTDSVHFEYKPKIRLLLRSVSAISLLVCFSFLVFYKRLWQAFHRAHFNFSVKK